MAEKYGGKSPNPEFLWREYESCQNTAQGLEKLIWQTNVGGGVGSITLLYWTANNISNDQTNLVVACLLGVAVFFFSMFWFFISRRWWSIQHSCYLRMKHIEEDLNLYKIRYLDYLDEPKSSKIIKLPKKQRKELKKRASNYSVGCVRKKINKWFKKIGGHQREGIQGIILVAIAFNLIIWIAIILYAFVKQ